MADLFTLTDEMAPEPGSSILTKGNATYLRTNHTIDLDTSSESFIIDASCDNFAHCATMRKLLGVISPELLEGVKYSPIRHRRICRKNETSSWSTPCKNISTIADQ